MERFEFPDCPSRTLQIPYLAAFLIGLFVRHVIDIIISCQGTLRVL